MWLAQYALVLSKGVSPSVEKLVHNKHIYKLSVFPMTSSEAESCLKEFNRVMDCDVGLCGGSWSLCLLPVLLPLLCPLVHLYLVSTSVL